MENEYGRCGVDRSDFYVPGLKRRNTRIHESCCSECLMDMEEDVSRFVVKHFSSQFRAIWKEHSMSSDLSLVLSKTFSSWTSFSSRKATQRN